MGFGVGVARTTISGLASPVAALLVTAFLVAVGLP